MSFWDCRKRSCGETKFTNMRKLRSQIQMTLDGYMGGPAGEMDWMKMPWSADLTQKIDQITTDIGCILLGRKLAEGFIPYWTSVATNPDNPEQKAGQKFINTPKVVFSKTLKETKWDNTIIAKGDIVDEVKKLKSQPGQDLIVYGGATLVNSLIENKLIDEINLFVNPVTLGTGLAVFSDRKNYKVMATTAYECGIVGLVLTPQ
jgi:dihydrofolate reductase